MSGDKQINAAHAAYREALDRGDLHAARLAYMKLVTSVRGVKR